MTDNNIKKAIVDELVPRGAKRISLFGSYSRGEAKPESDIDILVEFHKNTGTTLMDLVEMERELEESINRKVDLVTSGGVSPYILPYIKKDEIVIYEN